MALELTTSELLLNARAAIAGVGWAVMGAVLVASGIGRSRMAVASVGALLTGAVLAVGEVSWARDVLGPHGLSTFVQWLLVAAVVASALPVKRDPRALSFLPLVMVSWQGLGACAAAFMIAGNGTLASGQPRRAALLASLCLFSVALGIDENSLWCWGQAGSLFGLSMDGASWAVDLAEISARWLGFGALFIWARRPR